MKGVKRGGHKPKGAVVAEGFNEKKKGVPSTREIEKELQAKVDEIEKKVALKEKRPGKNSGKKSKTVEAPLEDDKQSAYRMLSDMRAVWKEAGGVKKLLKLLKKDDKLMVTMLKELMKHETSLLAAEIRSKETNPANGPQVTFVILKGLQTEDEVIKTSGIIDMEQVADAINPSAVPKIEYVEEMERPA